MHSYQPLNSLSYKENKYESSHELNNNQTYIELHCQLLKSINITIINYKLISEIISGLIDK